jgi:hypothetical protein
MPLAYPPGSRDPDTIAQTVADIVWMRQSTRVKKGEGLFGRVMEKLRCVV